MNIDEIVTVGMVMEESFVVRENHLASHLGSGSVQVLATPAMIAWMESIAHRLLARYLPEGQSSVGIQLDVHHLAPTPVEASVRVRAEVVAVEGNRISFRVQAWDEHEQVGKGFHQRVIIDQARFLKRVAAKAHNT